MQANDYRYEEEKKGNVEFPIKRLNISFIIDLDNNPNKLTIQTDHVHIFDTVHVETCEETCVIDEIISTVTLNNNGIDSVCNPDQCGM